MRSNLFMSSVVRSVRLPLTTRERTPPTRGGSGPARLPSGFAVPWRVYVTMPALWAPLIEVIWIILRSSGTTLEAPATSSSSTPKLPQ